MRPPRSPSCFPSMCIATCHLQPKIPRIWYSQLVFVRDELHDYVKNSPESFLHLRPSPHKKFRELGSLLACRLYGRPPRKWESWASMWVSSYDLSKCWRWAKQCRPVFRLQIHPILFYSSLSTFPKLLFVTTVIYFFLAGNSNFLVPCGCVGCRFNDQHIIVQEKHTRQAIASGDGSSTGMCAISDLASKYTASILEWSENLESFLT